MYRARATDDDLAAAVVSVGQALINLQDEPNVAEAAKDDDTVPYAKERLQALVSAMPAQPGPAQTDPGAAPKKKK
jgi:hypothetical protein